MSLCVSGLRFWISIANSVSQSQNKTRGLCGHHTEMLYNRLLSPTYVKISVTICKKEIWIFKILWLNYSKICSHLESGFIFPSYTLFISIDLFFVRNRFLASFTLTRFRLSLICTDVMKFHRKMCFCSEHGYREIQCLINSPHTRTNLTQINCISFLFLLRCQQSFVNHSCGGVWLVFTV